MKPPTYETGAARPADLALADGRQLAASVFCGFPLPTVAVGVPAMLCLACSAGKMAAEAGSGLWVDYRGGLARQA